ncbi:MAG TPA: hypothetical protein VGG99_01075 [Acetobacteraceae bacterium]|jgi:hypothetical protein
MPDAIGASPLLAQNHAPPGGAPGALPPGRVIGRPQFVAPPPLPRLSLVVEEEVADGWHAARLVQDRPSLDYYVQSVTVRGPFRVAHPWRGGADLTTLAPDFHTASRTHAINWDWIAEPDGSLVLPLFIKRTRLLWLRWPRPVKARLVVRDMTIKGTVTNVKLASNRIRWTRRVPWAV